MSGSSSVEAMHVGEVGVDLALNLLTERVRGDGAGDVGVLVVLPGSDGDRLAGALQPGVAGEGVEDVVARQQPDVVIDPVDGDVVDGQVAGRRRA